MSKNRLEAFSDEVVAIVITLMVLEPRAPLEATLAASPPVVPGFLSFTLGFVILGI